MQGRPLWDQVMRLAFVVALSTVFISPVVGCMTPSPRWPVAFTIGLVGALALVAPIIRQDRRTSPTAPLEPGAPPDFVTELLGGPGMESMGVQIAMVSVATYGNTAALRLLVQNTYDAPRELVWQVKKYFGEGLYNFEELIRVPLGPLEVGVMTVNASRANGKPLLRLVLNPWTTGGGGTRRRLRRFAEIQRAPDTNMQIALGMAGHLSLAEGVPWDITFTDDPVRAPEHPRFESKWKPPA